MALLESVPDRPPRDRLCTQPATKGMALDTGTAPKPGCGRGRSGCPRLCPLHGAGLPRAVAQPAGSACLERGLVSALSPISLSINGCVPGSKTAQITPGRIIIVLVAAAKLFHGHVGLAEK